MARTPSKIEKACDTILEDLNARLLEVDMERVQLYGTIRHIEERRRSAVRSSASVASKGRKAKADPEVES